ncbi:MAG: hypothetical protein ACLQVN_05465 [Bryobacteraceae bacterium]
MRVLVDNRLCELHEYDSSANRWAPKDEAAWPLLRSHADAWLVGWDDVDRFAAVNVLTKPPLNPEPPRRFPLSRFTDMV